MKRILCVFALTALAALPAMADTESKSDGCGIGNYVTSKKTLLGTTTRATTHYYLSPTYSMTSGTSGCDQHSIVKGEEAPMNYAVTNKDMLLIEMASGEGEYLQGLARTFGCDSSVAERFGRATQTHYKDLQEQGTRSGFEMYQGVKKVIREDQVLSTRCKVIG